jgi:type II secretory pathway component PulC
LSGIVVAPTSRSVILSGTDNRSIVVAEGETVDGWTVEEITPEKVVFTSDGRRQIFEVEQPGD